MIRIVVVAAAYEGRTEEQEIRDYDELKDFINRRYPRSQRPFQGYSLVLSHWHGSSGGESTRAIYPGDIEIDEKLINHGVAPASGGTRPTQAEKGTR
jgi:hypothetical protein